MGKEYMFIDHTNQNLNFQTISDFKWCMKQGGEVEFEYNTKLFGILHIKKTTPGSPNQILVFQKKVENQEDTEKCYNTADEALEYVIDGIRLRDIITKVEVTDRTI